MAAQAIIRTDMLIRQAHLTLVQRQKNGLHLSSLDMSKMLLIVSMSEKCTSV